MKADKLLPGFKDTQILTSYNRSQTCDGNLNTQLGSVTLRSNQVGFKCDLPAGVPIEDLKPIKCEADCFSAKKCQKHRKYFGLVDKTGTTCDIGSPGCDFEMGIDPKSRIVTTRHKDLSSFLVSLGIECEKKVGQTCTRNIVYRANYEQCPCVETKRDHFYIDESLVTVNLSLIHI